MAALCTSCRPQSGKRSSRRYGATIQAVWRSSLMRSIPNTSASLTGRAPTTLPARRSIRRRRRSGTGRAHVAYPKIVAAAGPSKISTITVIPGYDDRAVGRPPPRPVTDRWGGETYRVLWQEAVAAAPDYVLITSWNEWHEGSEIEPSVEYGSVMLNDTAAFAHQFLAGRK